MTAEPQDAPVQELYAKSWRQGEFDPLPRALSLRRVLEVAREDGMRLRPDPVGRLEGGAYEGGRVVYMDTRDSRMYFAVPAAGLPLLEGHMSPEDWRRLLSPSPEPRRRAR